MQAVTTQEWPAPPETPDLTARLRALFEALSAGEASALEGVYDLLARDIHGLALWRTGRAADAADVLQETFIRLARERHGLRDVRDPRAFVLRIAHRLAVDVHRRRARRREDPLPDVPLVVADVPSPERSAEAARASEMLVRLPPEQREALALHHAGCTFAEVGRITGVPTFTAASRYRLALNRLRSLLGVTP